MMLADEIMQSKIFPVILGERGFGQLRASISVANKFVLTPQFVSAADALDHNREQLARAIPFCRLPFRRCWFEFSNTNRRNWLAKAAAQTLHTPGELVTPNVDISRVGFAVMDVGGTWEAALFWSSGNGPQFCPVGIGLSESIRQNIAATFDRYGSATKGFETIHGGVYFAEDALARVAAHMDHFQRDTYAKNRIADWAGETAFLLSILALLNTRNVADTTFVDKTSHNAKRQRRGQLPLSSHYTLSIQPRLAASFCASASSDGEEGVRAHFVRGHWKARKTGLFFWSPHMRGDLERGFIHKDYAVEAPAP